MLERIQKKTHKKSHVGSDMDTFGQNDERGRALHPYANQSDLTNLTANEHIGSYLKAERLKRRISLEDIAQSTRIPLKMLQRIEEGEVEALPGEVFQRGFLRSYAHALGLNDNEVLHRFGYGDSIPILAPAPMTALTRTERGQRFSVAIVMIVLCMLITLAVSILLRPRRHQVPVQLSNIRLENNMKYLACYEGNGQHASLLNEDG